ncbi:unnamed protein product [Urochloa decumbens]|uniref:Uncharacterized protein n=1 Tax=Urochloa decumbens TaxID=240449 RepID=A0ABC8VHL4_9POAL
MEHRRSGGGDGSPSPGDEAAVRPKRRRRKGKRRVSDPVVPIPGGALARAPEALKHKDFQGTSFSDRSGGSVSSASAHPDREGGDERMEHRRSGGGDGSPSPGEEAAVRPKRRRRKEKRPLSDRQMIEQRVSMPKERMRERKERKKEKRSLKEKLLDKLSEKEKLLDALVIEESLKQQQQQHKTSSLSPNLLPNNDCFAGLQDAEASAITPSGKIKGNRVGGKIAQDEDEGRHSGKKTTHAVEDEKHSDKIDAHAIEEHKQEHGSASGLQALLDMDAETVTEKILYFSERLNFDTPECGDYHPEYDQEQLYQLGEQLALYRIRAYELTMDRNPAELRDENLKLEYPASKLYDNGFFKNYEESLEWYFDPQRCKSGCFDNYQRLVLHDHGYLDWDFYYSILNTYEEDRAYVQYFEEVANKTKWIEDYLGEIKWERIRSLALMQALEIAAGFPNVSPLLVTYGFQEYINSIQRYYSCKGLDGLYFEIWKRVAKGKMSFKEALLEIDSKDMFPSRRFQIKHELENTLGSSPMKDYYDARVAGIDKMASDDKARQLIREVVRASVSKPKYYLDYTRKKLDIANDIELIPKGRGRVVAAQRGDASAKGVGE